MTHESNQTPIQHIERDSGLGEFFKKNFVALALQAVSVVVLLANLWLTSQLAPLAEGIREVKQAQAQQATKIDEHDKVLDRFIVVEEKVKTIETVTRDTQNDVRTLLLNNANNN